MRIFLKNDSEGMDSLSESPFRLYLIMAVMAISGLGLFGNHALAQSTPPPQTVNALPVPEMVNAELGATFMVELVIDPNGGSVSVADIAMSFNPEILQVTNLELAEGTALSNTVQPGSIDNEAGSFSIGGFGFTAATEAFTHVVISFEAVATGSTTVDHITSGLPKTTLAFAGFEVTGNTPSISVNITTIDADCPELGVNNGDPCTVDGLAGAYVDCECLVNDCNGVPGGSAVIDNCGNCVGGDTGEEPCTGSLSGSVNWNATCGSRSGVLSLYEPGTAILVETIETEVSAEGEFQVSDLPVGTFDLFIKVVGFLQKSAPDVAIEADGTDVDFGNLIPGELSGDNAITVPDFSAFSAAYGTSEGDASFNFLADFNCDGTIDIQDYSLFSSLYGSIGENPEVAVTE